MTTIVTRNGKGSSLSWIEADANFTNLNVDKLETSNNLSDLTNALLARTNLGLGNVDNTSDANKPVSTAQQTAIDLSITDHIAASDPHTQYLLESSASASSGSSLIGFTQGITGSVSRTVQSVLRETISVKDFGAVGDGITDDTVAIQAALNHGGRIYGEGVFLISEKLTATKDGTHLYGPAASWGDATFNGKCFSLRAAPSLVADFLLEFKNPNQPELRSVGVEDVGIDISTNTPDCGGLAVYGAYDSSSFRNINITGVAPNRVGFLVSAGKGYATYDRSTPTQTVFFENIWAIKRTTSSSTAPAIRLWGVQESTFVNCKAWHTSTTNAAWEVASSNGIMLIAPSFVNSGGYGLDIIEDVGSCEGVGIETPTFEMCLNTIRTRTTDAYMFGTITAVPAIGATVWQPADGSMALGYVFFSNSGGVYVSVAYGTFSTGVLYNNSGVSIGTISALQTVGNRAVALTNPRTIGAATVGSVAGGDFKALKSSRIHLPDDSDSAFTHVYTVDDTVVNNTFIANRFGNMIGSGKYNEVTSTAELTFVYTGTPNTALWPFTSNEFDLANVNPSVRKITLVRPQSTIGFVALLSTGVTILPYAVSTSFRLYGGALVLRRIGTAQWVIEQASGNILAVGGAGRIAISNWMQTRTATFAADANTVMGSTVNNTGATATVNLNMSAIGDAVPVGTQFTISRTAAQILRVTPAPSDTIFGASAAGKYVQLDSTNAFLTLEVMTNAGYNIVASQGTYSFQP